jgi:uncharacterized OB-fold protein
MSTSGSADQGAAEGPARPLPAPDERSAGFWAALAEHRLVMRRCQKCGWLSYPPDVICASCLSPERAFDWQAVSGRGVLRSWTVVHTAFLPGFAPYVPYVVAAVELEEQPGLRLTARLAAPPGSGLPGLEYGRPVETEFEDLSQGVTVPVFRLVMA